MADARVWPLIELAKGRTREFLRQPEAMFWVFAFPILLAFALGIAFQNRGAQTVHVVVEQGLNADALVETLIAAGGIEAIGAEGHASPAQAARLADELARLLPARDVGAVGESLAAQVLDARHMVGGHVGEQFDDHAALLEFEINHVFHFGCLREGGRRGEGNKPRQ